jgi:glutathione peroxidase
VLEFATSTYGVTFPMFAKTEVNGDAATPLYAWLKESQPGTGDSPDIVWNFTKFLVDKNGNAVKRYEPQVTPEEIAADLAEYL